ncbi:tripartite tricarboxylate transporter permease [Effusibacillus dendaii]|uniref:tripartite tricarboxylate transporter permease n=1 Tax=Effusibacillus dendaii TaxID=2743772 RepID=UPI001909D49E|nr:tripartite tricarboxylate transporter permease [Effusibacillus dendaii]
MDHLLSSFDMVFTWYNLLAIVAGVVLGMLFGVTPGLDATSGTSLLLAFTYSLSQETALIFLCALYMAATYSGSITAITVGIPGTPASASTVLDGYELNKQGKAGKALAISISSAVIGGLIGTVALVSLTAPLANIAVKFSAPEYFMLALIGLLIIGGLLGNSRVKGIAMAIVGLFITVIGLDPFTGYPRFTFGFMELMEGISYIPVMIGMFAISEALFMITTLDQKNPYKSGTINNNWPNRKEWKQMVKPMASAGVIGTFLGALPGIGAATANWVTYNEAKRISKEPEMYGKGSIEGLASSEVGAMATVSSSMIPMFTLGIPGSTTDAVLIGALIMHGIVPGPQLMTRNADLVYSVFIALFVIIAIMFIVGAFGVKFWVKMLQAPKGLIVSIILTMSVVGAFSLKNSLMDVWIMFASGILAFVLRKYGYPIVPLILGMVLGQLMQDNFRRALIMSGNGFEIFLTRPISLVILLFIVIGLVYPLLKNGTKGKQKKKHSSEVIISD